MTEKSEMEEEALRLQPAGLPQALCPEAMIAYALLHEAHAACFNAPDRPLLGMSHGPFSGVNRVLGLICSMNETIARQRAEIKKLREASAARSVEALA